MNVEDEPKSLNRLEVMRALRISNYEMAFWSAFTVFLGGAFVTGFALWIGANYFWIGLLAALPSITFIFQIPGAAWADRFRSRRYFTVRSAFVERISFIPIIFLALFATHQPKAVEFSVSVLLLILFFTISSTAGSIGTSAWMAWITDLVPADMRGRYFGKRNSIMIAVSIALSLPAAWFMDYSVKNHWMTQRTAFASYFALGVLFTLISLYMMWLRPEQPRSMPDETPDWKQSFSKLGNPFADEQFRRIILYICSVRGSVGMVGPFFTVYMLQNLNLGYFEINLFGTFAGIAGILTLPTWGFLGDKYGNKPTLVISSLLVVIPPLLWMLVVPDRSYLFIMITLTLMNIIASPAWNGIELNHFNLVMAKSKEEERTMYFAAYYSALGVTAFAAPLIGGILMTLMTSIHIEVVHRFQAMFFLSALGRFFSVFWIRRLHEPHASSASYVISQLKGTKPAGLLALRRLSKGRSEQVRTDAVKVLGETKTLMAVGELIAALDDPSIEVRRQAAQSLGQIGDPKAVPALIQKLRDDSAHINTEAAEALGQIGHSDATSALLEQLQHPDPAVRLAVTDALSKVSSHHQVEPSIDSAQLTQSVEEIQDLPVDEIIQLLLAPEVFVRANAAEALRCLNSHKAVQALRQSLAKEEDVQALSAMAYALGWLGDPDDAKLLLNLLIQSDASLVRKRIALGIAHLWGVEKELYSYFSYDGMHRDNAVMKSLQPLSKRHPHLPIALEAYAGGRYNEFIHEISSCFLDYAPLQLLAKYGHTESADHELSLLAVVILESKG